MIPALTDTITYEQFLTLPWSQIERIELVRGVMVPKHNAQESPARMSPGGEHGVIQTVLASFLLVWAREHNSGQVGTEMGFVLKREPPTVRIPDIAFVRRDLVPRSGVPKGFWEMAPDMAVEVISPNDTANELLAKTREYLDAGTSLVLVVYPELAEVAAYTYDGESRLLRIGDTLAFPDVLPGFECKVEDIFS